MHHFVRLGLLVLLFAQLLPLNAQSLLRDSVINTRFHTYEEIVAYMDSIDQLTAYDAIVDVIEIGQSNNEELPIYAMKFSDNPTIDEDEAALLFLGQCHAEEVLGVEITMGLIDTLLHGFDALNPHVLSILQNLEIWVVPTYNPEGLRVVHDGTDITYRKNKTDNNGNGIFDFVPGIGFDLDGVDFNRNYDFNWIFGDGYGVDDYDYYRGPEAFSESETRAIADLAKQEKFLMSVAYHSARSGTPEIIYYSWQWEESKFPPDIEVMSSLAYTLSERIINESGDGNYAVTPGKTQRGNAHDWFYTQTGAIQFLVEVGTNNLQPNADIIDDTVERNLEGLFFLMDRAIGRTPESKSQIRGIVTDASDGFPLEGAQVELAKLNVDGSITELEGLMMQPRVTDDFGRYRRLLNQATYRVIASAPGFLADTVAAVLTSDSYATILDFSLTPMMTHQIELNLAETDNNANYQVIIWDESQSDTLNVSAGFHAFEWRGDRINFDVTAPGHFPESHFYDLTPYPTEAPFNLSLALPFEPTTIFSSGFNDLDGWTDAENWVVTESRLLSQSELFYGEALDMVTEYPLIDLSSVPDAKRLGVFIKHRYEVEWHNDTLALEIWSADESDLLLKKQWFDQRYEDHTETFFVNRDLPASVKLKLLMTTDSTVAYRGWEIDSLALFVTDIEMVGVDPEIEEHSTQSGAKHYEIATSVSPNPFRAQTRLDFEIPMADRVTLTIFDIRGREIFRERMQAQAGRTSWVWARQDMKGHPVSTGVYFVRLQTSHQATTHKMLVMNQF